VQLGYPPYRIDIFTAIDGVAFEQAWERRSLETPRRGARSGAPDDESIPWAGGRGVRPG
jgi:hypothetical protein